MAAKKIHKLEIQKPFSFLVVGISSYEKIFVVSNELNRLLNIELDHLQSIEIEKEDVQKTFHAYSYFSEEDGLMFSIISNNGNNGVLFESYRKLDYLVILSGENQPAPEALPLIKLKESKLFLAVSFLTISSQKENKLFLEVISQLWHNK